MSLEEAYVAAWGPNVDSSSTIDTTNLVGASSAALSAVATLTSSSLCTDIDSSNPFLTTCNLIAFPSSSGLHSHPISLELRFRSSFPASPPAIRITTAVTGSDSEASLLHGLPLCPFNSWKPDDPSALSTLVVKLHEFLSESSLTVDSSAPPCSLAAWYATDRRIAHTWYDGEVTLGATYQETLQVFGPEYAATYLSQTFPDEFTLGTRVVLPSAHVSRFSFSPSALCFQVTSPPTRLPTIPSFCGVLQFTAPPGLLFAPSHVMTAMHLQDGDKVTVSSAGLPKLKSVQLQPLSSSWNAVPPETRSLLLKAAFEHASTVAFGDQLDVPGLDGVRHSFVVTAIEPAARACAVWTGFREDLPVSFLPREEEEEKEVDDVGSSPPSTNTLATHHSSPTTPAESTEECKSEPQPIPVSLPTEPVAVEPYSATSPETVVLVANESRQTVKFMVNLELPLHVFLAAVFTTFSVTSESCVVSAGPGRTISMTEDPTQTIETSGLSRTRLTIRKAATDSLPSPAVSSSSASHTTTTNASLLRLELLPFRPYSDRPFKVSLPNLTSSSTCLDLYTAADLAFPSHDLPFTIYRLSTSGTVEIPRDASQSLLAVGVGATTSSTATNPLVVLQCRIDSLEECEVAVARRSLSASWACSMCTFENKDPTAVACTVCGVRRATPTATSTDSAPPKFISRMCGTPCATTTGTVATHVVGWERLALCSAHQIPWLERLLAPGALTASESERLTKEFVIAHHSSDTILL